MGLFDLLFKPHKDDAVYEYFQTLTAYQPTFHTRAGGLYEADATRAAIHATAVHCSKLTPHVEGNAGKRYEKMLKHCPNPFMTCSQFLYRIATILEVENTAFIVPMHSPKDANEIVGLYPVLPSMCELRQKDGKPILKFTFPNGKAGYMDYFKCGVLTKMQYNDDFFGASNKPLGPTMDVINMQHQAMTESIKQGATPRFMARLGNSVRDEDLAKEQKRFSARNLSMENSGGVMMFDSKYADVKQIAVKPYVVDADQMKLINDNVQRYFGVNDKILRNEWDEQTWDAFYEGKIEPFALQLGMVLSKMLFSDRELGTGNEIMFAASRLQFATVNTKVNTIVQLYDRGMMSRNEGREIMQMPSIGPEGDEFFIRGEYVNSKDKTDQEEPKDKEDEPDDEGSSSI